GTTVLGRDFAISPVVFGTLTANRFGAGGGAPGVFAVNPTGAPGAATVAGNSGRMPAKQLPSAPPNFGCAQGSFANALPRTQMRCAVAGPTLIRAGPPNCDAVLM